jgi:3-phenylpropionate/trans-cinnamate dioxygenase ferredoxin reductase component
MAEAKFVIAGGGMVAGYAAKQMVELGLRSGELAIFSNDTVVPYERPPLSKSFLAGKETEEAITINSEHWYREHGIAIHLGCAVSAVDLRRKRLTVSTGPEFGFDKLLIASGSNVRKLMVPGASLPNVYYLRTMEDSKRIRGVAEKVKRAVVVGGGFIGMEVASQLAQKQIEVTMVLNEDRIWKRFFSPEMSKFFEDYYTARGVRFLRSTEITELRGHDAVSSVAVSGGYEIPCEMVVAGIGVQPSVDFLTNSGIELDNGVLVNEYLETNQPGVFAAGDVANYNDVLFGKRRRVEHWDNAVSQAQHCARSLMGQRAAFKHVPYFFSDVFDLSYEYWGDASVADQVIHRGDLSSNSFSVWWLRQQVVVGAFSMNRPVEERNVCEEWIMARQRLIPQKLADASQPITAALELKDSAA